MPSRDQALLGNTRRIPCRGSSCQHAAAIQTALRGRCLPTCTVPATTQGTWQQYATLPDTSGPAPTGEGALPAPPAVLLLPLPAVTLPLPTGWSSPSRAARMDDFPAPT